MYLDVDNNDVINVVLILLVATQFYVFADNATHSMSDDSI